MTGISPAASAIYRPWLVAIGVSLRLPSLKAGIRSILRGIGIAVYDRFALWLVNSRLTNIQCRVCLHFIIATRFQPLFDMVHFSFSAVLIILAVIYLSSTWTEALWIRFTLRSRSVAFSFPHVRSRRNVRASSYLCYPPSRHSFWIAVQVCVRSLQRLHFVNKVSHRHERKECPSSIQQSNKSYCGSRPNKC